MGPPVRALTCAYKAEDNALTAPERRVAPRGCIQLLLSSHPPHGALDPYENTQAVAQLLEIEALDLDTAGLGSWQSAVFLAAGPARADAGGLVFVTRWGEPLYPDTVTALMTKLINRYNKSATPPAKAAAARPAA